MTREVVKHNHLLKALYILKPKQRIALLKTLDRNAVKCICECIYNILTGTVPLSTFQKQKLKKHKNILRSLVKKYPVERKKQILIQKGNGFLPLILAPLITGIFSSLFK